MKKFTTIVLVSIIFLQAKSFAQFNTTWTANYQHTTANNFSNESRKVVADAAGNAYVLADATSNIDPTGVPGTTTWHYTVLSKYSPTGVLLVTRNINVFNHMVSGFDNKGAFGLAMDAAENLYVGYTTFDAITDFDANIAEYNTNLVRLWNHKFNPSGSDRGVDVGVSPGGEAYGIVASTTGANVQYHFIKATSQTTTSVPLYSLVLNTDVLNRVIVTSSNIYATGYRVISGFKNVLSVKVNPSGVLKWQRTFNGGSAARDDFGQNLTMGADGYIYITGTSDQGIPTGNDVIIMKLQDSNGAKLWARYKDFNHSTTDAGYFVDASDINYVYAGSVSSNTILLERLETALGNSGGRVNYIPLPSSPYATITSAALTDMKVSPNFCFYLTGNVTATDMSSQAFSAAFLVKYSVHLAGRSTFRLDAVMPVEGNFSTSKSSASIAFDFFKDDIYWLRDSYSTHASHASETVVLTDLNIAGTLRYGSAAPSTMSEGSIAIYPNPSHSFISVSSNEVINMIELFDITGKKVKTFTAASETVTLDLSGFMNGIYLCKIYPETGTISTRKIIKN